MKKLAAFILEGFILAIITFGGTWFWTIFLFLLVAWGVPLNNLFLGYDISNDPNNPLVYLIMIPAIAFSILFSRGNSTYNTSVITIFEANSLKEAVIEGVGWAAIQFVAIFAIYSMDIRDLAWVWQMIAIYLMPIGTFIGPLLNYVFNKASKL
jgi:hypothetical protein